MVEVDDGDMFAFSGVAVANAPGVRVLGVGSDRSVPQGPCPVSVQTAWLEPTGAAFDDKGLLLKEVCFASVGVMLGLGVDCSDGDGVSRVFSSELELDSSLEVDRDDVDEPELDS